MDLQELRDLIIVISGILAIVTLLAVLIVTIVIAVAARGLIAAVSNAVRDSLPILAGIRETVDTVRGTTTFVSETTVSPIIRTFGIIFGIRHALAVLLGFRRRRGR